MDYSVNLTAKDNLSGTIKQCKQAVQEFGNAASTNMDKFRQRFEKIEGSAAPLKKQLRDLRALMSEMNFKGMSGTEEFTQIAMYAGQVKDAMDDAGAATRRFADDTFALKAAADAVNLVTGAFTAVTGAMNLFGVKNEEVKNAILKVQSAMAILNGVQAVANALNKDSALMQALKAMKMRYTTEMTRLNSLETNKNTIAEVANKVASEADAAAKTKAAIATNIESASTKKSTIVQNAWNIAKAVAKALIGDFSGLAIVAAGAIATYAMATADSTEKIEDQTDALKDNNKIADANTIWKERMKKSEQEWSDAVTNNASNQIAQYTKLQLKWLECNKDQKQREKFQREYGEEVNRVAGKVMKLSEYENFFVRDTDKVVAAILARAAAEAGAQKYAEAMLKKAENDRNGTRANGRYYTVYHEGDLLTDEQAQQLHDAAGLSYYHNQDLVMTGRLDYGYKLSKAGAEKATQFYKQRAEQIRAQDDAEINFWKNWSSEQSRKAAEAEKAAGMGVGGGGSNYHPPKAFSGGGGSPSGSGSKGSSGNKGGSGSGDNKNPEQEVKPLAQSLEWMRQQLQELQKQLSYGLIPSDKIEEAKSKVEYLKKSIEEKEIELGFKVVPIEGSLEWLEEQYSQLQKKIEGGLISDDDLEKEKLKLENWADKIQQKKIQLGFEAAPETAYEQSEKQRTIQLNDYKEYLRHITKYARDNDEFMRNQKGYEEYLEKLRQVEEEEEELQGTTQVATDSYNKMEAELQNLTRQYQEGAITIDEYDKRVEELSHSMNNLDEVVTTAFKKLEAPMTFDLGKIPRTYEDAIEAIDKMLKEDELSVDARIRLNETKQSLQQKMNDITKGEFVIKAVVEPEYFKTGTADWLSENYNNASQQLQKIQDQYNQGIIKTSDEARQKVAEINAELKKLGLKPIEIEIKTKGQQVLEDTQEYLGQFNDVVVGTVDSIGSLVNSIDEGASGWEIFKNALSTAEQIMTSIGTVMQVINTLQDAYNVSKLVGNAADEQSASNKAVEAIAQGAIASSSPAVVGAIEAQATTAGTAIAPLKMLASATTELAAAQMFAAHASIPFVGGALGAAQVGIMMGTLAALKALDKFAGGGIVGGHSYSGDKLIARVNSGEMILNSRQQKNLFNAINNGDIGGKNAQSISFKIKGSDLYGTLKNYSKIKGKSGITTGIQ